MWSVCLTSKGVLNYLNRRISPVGECACQPASSLNGKICLPRLCQRACILCLRLGSKCPYAGLLSLQGCSERCSSQEQPCVTVPTRA